MEPQQTTPTPRPQITSISPNAGAQKPKRKANWLAIILLLISLTLAGLLVWCWFYYPHPAPSGSTTTGNGSEVATATGPCHDGAENTLPAGYRFYENTDLGFKFAYPEAWGDVTIETTPMGGTSGHYLSGHFSANDKLIFGGNGTDYVVEGRGGMATDNPGYLEVQSKYYTVQLWRFHDAAGETTDDYELYPITDEVTIKQTCNTKAVVTRHPEMELLEAHDLARINLQPSNLYYGVNFMLKEQTEAARADFDKLLATFQLIP